MAKIITAEMNFFICGGKKVGKKAILKKIAGIRASRTEVSDRTVLKTYVLGNLSYDLRFTILDNPSVHKTDDQEQDGENKGLNFKAVTSFLRRHLKNDDNVFNFALFIFDLEDLHSLNSTINYIEFIEKEFHEFFQLYMLIGNKLDSKAIFSAEEMTELKKIKDNFVGNYYEISTCSFFNFSRNFYEKIVTTCFTQLLPKEHLEKTLSAFLSTLSFKESFPKSTRQTISVLNDNPGPDAYSTELYSIADYDSLPNRFSSKIFANKIGPVFKEEKRNILSKKEEADFEGLDFNINLSSSFNEKQGFSMGNRPGNLGLIYKRRLKKDQYLEPINALFNSMENIYNRKSPEKIQATVEEREELRRKAKEEERLKRESLKELRRSMPKPAEKVIVNYSIQTTENNRKAMYLKKIDFNTKLSSPKIIEKKFKVITPGPGHYEMPAFLNLQKGFSFGSEELNLPKVVASFPKYVKFETDFEEIIRKNKERTLPKPTIPRKKHNYFEKLNENKIDSISWDLSRF